MGGGGACLDEKQNWPPTKWRKGFGASGNEQLEADEKHIRLKRTSLLVSGENLGVIPGK